MSPAVQLLRVATFNVHHCAGTDGRIDVERVAEATRSTGADLVAFQEVDRNLARTAQQDQAAELAARTSLQVHFHATVRTRGGEYGIALASRDDLETRFVSLPRLGREEPRGAIVGRWRGISVVATHLSTTPTARRVQTDALAALAEDQAAPVVVLGDLNQTRPGLGALRRRGFEAAVGPATFRAGFRAKQIDHVLVAGGLRIERAWTVRSPASDHLPLVVELERF